MPTFNTGIRTNAGINLFNRVDSGQTKITYTRIVFSSKDLSKYSDDQIMQLTDIQPQELVQQPSVHLHPANTITNQETEIRATVDNHNDHIGQADLKQGFYINTYALYAKDDSGHEVLYGIDVDKNPSYLPAYDGVLPQAITYNWDTTISNTKDVHFTDSHDEYATYGDLQDYKKAIDSSVTKYCSEADNASITKNTAFNQLAAENAMTSSAVDGFSNELSSNVNMTQSISNSASNNADHISSISSQNTINSKAINAALNQLAVSQPTSSTSNNKDEFNALLAAFNQTAVDNAMLRDQLLSNGNNKSFNNAVTNTTLLDNLDDKVNNLQDRLNKMRLNGIKLKDIEN